MVYPHRSIPVLIRFNDPSLVVLAMANRIVADKARHIALVERGAYLPAGMRV